MNELNFGEMVYYQEWTWECPKCNGLIIAYSKPKDGEIFTCRDCGTEYTVTEGEA